MARKVLYIVLLLVAALIVGLYFIGLQYVLNTQKAANNDMEEITKFLMENFVNMDNAEFKDLNDIQFVDKDGKMLSKPKVEL